MQLAVPIFMTVENIREEQILCKGLTVTIFPLVSTLQNRYHWRFRSSYECIFCSFKVYLAIFLHFSFFSFEKTPWQQRFFSDRVKWKGHRLKIFTKYDKIKKKEKAELHFSRINLRNVKLDEIWPILSDMIWERKKWKEEREWNKW